MTPDTKLDLSDCLFSDLDLSTGAVAAVSGGSDSTALLLLLKDHLNRTASAARLLAVTIDHGLRPDSATEARLVQRFCAERGIAHRILAWRGDKPATGLPAAAREARYRLLAEAAGAEGIKLIVTGHTADDQAETVLMRQARDEEGRGLAGMAPATLHDWRTWIVRPLLGTRRAVLRAMLRARDIGWIEDPTNVDIRFERPRVRAKLGQGDGERRIAEALTRSQRAALERHDIGRRAAVLIDAFADRPVPGLIRLDRELTEHEDGQAAIYALRILLATVGGMSFLADEARCAALLSRLRSAPLCATLSRTVVDARRTGIFLRRENRNLPAALPPSDNQLWDNRRRITLKDGPGGMVIAPLGSAAPRKAPLSEDVPQSLSRAALAAEPALWSGDERLDFTGGDAGPRAVSMVPVVAPFARFLPSFDLAPAAAVAALVGAPPPAPPFHGHDGGRGWAKA
ncbi:MULTISPECIES: tRNA lysidine(34) synthetase TilS [unclassified Mesorhizobium]|uniref:tRNA lysidine(34) synthetase TilS n=1 Tax=unclassified Mesorhizobium TaxID=325217 RepID=UPI00112EC3EE|nr:MULTISPECIES: tRNA lysidine(34) synthetase TilS [unclassified Mesorhizobium]TPK99962.1 tRNA lysidine(34) synthetase TilS [Mesorhizobium sp. B2-4-16]TPL65307.1 tRNA lysidine(34) synthetase TilS [Mesorhizobium sp. B2-4-3]